MDIDRLIGIFGLVFVVAIAARVFLVYRQNGYLPVIFGNPGSTHDYVHKVLAGILLLEALNILFFRLHALPLIVPGGSQSTMYRFLCPIHGLEFPTLKIFGLVIAYLGLFWSVIAQTQMGKDWRVGIDEEHDTSLVTQGLYGNSRHPIYVGFMVVTIGIFLALPNIASLVCVVLTIVVLSIEARLEEEFLLSRHGEQYRDYLSRTRRWV